MGISATRAQRRQLERDNARQPTALREVPRDEWPNPAAPQLRVLRSRDFLVQEFPADAPALVRLSVCRTALHGDRWQDGIAWDDLQRLKRECGYAATQRNFKRTTLIRRPVDGRVGRQWREERERASAERRAKMAATKAAKHAAQLEGVAA